MTQVEHAIRSVGIENMLPTKVTSVINNGNNETADDSAIILVEELRRKHCIFVRIHTIQAFTQILLR